MHKNSGNIAGHQVADYQKDGVICLRGAFGSHWIELLRRATDDAMANPGPHAEHYGEKDNGRFYGDLDTWTRTPAFRMFVFDSPAAEIAASVMQSSKATLLYDQLLVKEPGAQEKTPWHQDQPYWAVRGRQVCSIWVTMDPVPEQNCPEYVRGSHYWEEFNPQHFDDHTPYRGTGLPALPDIESDRESYDIVRFDLEPGDCLIFQAMIAHGAPGNSSTTHRRRGYSTRWLGDDACYCERIGEVAIPTFRTRFKDGDAFSGEMFPTVYRE